VHPFVFINIIPLINICLYCLVYYLWRILQINIYAYFICCIQLFLSRYIFVLLLMVFLLQVKLFIFDIQSLKSKYTFSILFDFSNTLF
jgi:hypothetical protein